MYTYLQTSNLERYDVASYVQMGQGILIGYFRTNRFRIRFVVHLRAETTSGIHLPSTCNLLHASTMPSSPATRSLLPTTSAAMHVPTAPSELCVSTSSCDIPVRSSSSNLLCASSASTCAVTTGTSQPTDCANNRWAEAHPKFFPCRIS